MKIEFVLKDKQTVSIIGINDKGERKEVGEIFTPAGSGHTTTNAIQICGFTEAYDLWGCAKYAQTACNDKGQIVREEKMLEDSFAHFHKEMVDKLAQVKDIQLQFSYDTRLHWEETRLNCCLKCYNVPCTCEVKVAHENPYMVKRQQDLHIEHVEEKSPEQIVKDSEKNPCSVNHKLTKALKSAKKSKRR